MAMPELLDVRSGVRDLLEPQGIRGLLLDESVENRVTKHTKVSRKKKSY
jgi:hypothetical protein